MMVVAVRYLMFVVCCLLRGVRRVLFVVWSLLSVVC